ncbi:MAG: TrbC/VirB2 family protein [candidate division KSB1 bacterium]|nr:TrbC/VirB2 family protein [candidate division KSB1 bacterium]MDZ7273757.1 TrbC/VirB2 family protein [candidate division KSB1 bacterium]MDZ7285913.1 TrbC/VirB2 family protein [candidate division KSB1 bacterium]MDZ7298945.1 TrbC/VirB2 family protein [candidate division KSB1 bacterium]MDZ7307621.1 TrbC/VirB2 family protein [candidate division KSB1 bacterium]
MQTVIQALNQLTNALLILASPVMVIALIIAGLNMASADGGRHEKAKKQLIGVALAAIVIFGSKAIVSALISFVPGANVSF